MAENLPQQRLEKKRFSRRKFLKACSGFALAGGTTIAYGSTAGVNTLQIEHVTARIPGLAPRWHNRRIVHLSDLHHGRTNLSLIVRSLEMAAELKPDFLVITGDFVDNKSADVDELARALKPFTSRIESLGCTGNHDYNHDPNRARAVCEALQSAGIRMLRNEFHMPQKALGPGDLCFAGVDDLWNEEYDPAVLTRTPKDAATILLCHNPDCWDILTAFRFDLMLSGHTHGGQVCVPFVGPLILPVENRSRYAGAYYPDKQNAHRMLYITRGVGHLTKIRLFCPPEVTCITLQGT